MDEKERKATSDLFNLLLEVATERANQLDVDEPPVVLQGYMRPVALSRV